MVGPIYAAQLAKVKTLLASLWAHRPYTQPRGEPQMTAWSRVYDDVWGHDKPLYDVQVRFAMLMAIPVKHQRMQSGWDAAMRELHADLSHDYARVCATARGAPSGEPAVAVDTGQDEAHGVDGEDSEETQAGVARAQDNNNAVAPAEATALVVAHEHLVDDGAAASDRPLALVNGERQRAKRPRLDGPAPTEVQWNDDQGNRSALEADPPADTEAADRTRGNVKSARGRHVQEEDTTNKRTPPRASARLAAQATATVVPSARTLRSIPRRLDDGQGHHHHEDATSVLVALDRKRARPPPPSRSPAETKTTAAAMPSPAATASSNTRSTPQSSPAKLRLMQTIVAAESERDRRINEELSLMLQYRKNCENSTANKLLRELLAKLQS